MRGLGPPGKRVAAHEDDGPQKHDPDPATLPAHSFNLPASAVPEPRNPARTAKLSNCHVRTFADRATTRPATTPKAT